MVVRGGASYVLYNEDCLEGLDRIAAESVDLVIADAPYGLGKDYGNDSDRRSAESLVAWTGEWAMLLKEKLKKTGLLYSFVTWRHAPEIFSLLKKEFTMVNEIIWDRKVPSMGGSTRRFSSVHDNIGVFAKGKDYYFNIDAVRVPYDEKTKKARTRSIFVGKKWLEKGYNPKDLWSIARLHRLHREREDHPTQKPLALIERIVLSSSAEGGVVLDPFAGSGTTLVAAYKHGRHSIGFELNEKYCDLIHKRMEKVAKECIGDGERTGAGVG